MLEQAFVNKIISLEQSIKDLSMRLTKIEVDLENYATDKSVEVRIQETDNNVRENAVAIRDLQTQLQNVVLPDNIRYYLSQSEVSEFRKNYKQILAMLADVDEKYKALVNYTTNAT